VPDSVGDVLKAHGHLVIFHRDVLSEKTPDDVVCATALENDAILVAIDADMKRMAKRYGAAVAPRFEKLSLIQLCCTGPAAAARVDQAMALIEQEWAFVRAKAARRLWIDISTHFIRTNR
jgi:hypothetical protein